MSFFKFKSRDAALVIFSIGAAMGLVAFNAFAATTISTNIQTDGTLSVTGTTTIMGHTGIGTSTPLAQLDLENWTVTSSGVGSGNPQFEMNGTLTPGASAAIGSQWEWGTSGTASTNAVGLRLNVDSGYTGSGSVAGIIANANAAGERALNGENWGGNIGAVLASQSNYTSDATLGDNIGVYAIAGGSQKFDVGIFSRAADDAASPPNTVVTVGVAGASGSAHGTASLSSLKSVIGGAFTIGVVPGQASWYTNPESTALLLDNETTAAPLLIGRINGVDTDVITGTGSAGIGTSTPVANFQVANGAATTTMEIGSAGQNAGSCLKLYRTDGSAIYAYVAAGATTFTLTTTACANVTNF